MPRPRDLWRLALAGLATSCARHAPPAAPPPATARFVLERAWRGDGAWFYPRERYDWSETGIADIAAARAGRAADGEDWSETALVGAHQTLQLPCVVRVTDLANGRALLVRVVDRGPATPHRVLAVTPRVATLLGAGDGPFPVRIDVEGSLSRGLTDALGGGAPRLAISAAPTQRVLREDLNGGAPSDDAAAEAEDTPSRRVDIAAPLPETPMLGPASAVRYLVLGGRYASRSYARAEAGRMDGGSVRARRQARSSSYEAAAGPFATIGQADAALDQALRAGLKDARIVVE